MISSNSLCVGRTCFTFVLSLLRALSFGLLLVDRDRRDGEEVNFDAGCPPSSVVSAKTRQG